MKLFFKLLFVYLLPIRIFMPIVVDIIELNFFSESYFIIQGRAESFYPKRKGGQISKDLVVSYYYKDDLDSLILYNVYSSVRLGDTIDVFISKKDGSVKCKENNDLTRLACILLFTPVICFFSFKAIDKAIDDIRNKVNLS